MKNNRVGTIDYLLWTPTFLVLAFFAYIGFSTLHEAWNILALKDIDGYAWGIVNENPWYYETPNLYGQVMLIEGIVLSTLVVLSTVAIFKHNFRKFTFCFLACLAFFTLMLLLGNLQ